MTWIGNSLQLGRFAVPIWLLASLAGLGGAYITSRLLYRRSNETYRSVFDLLSNTFFIFLIVWKLSPLIFQFSQIVRQPVSLLYLPGGAPGAAAGAAAALIYFTIKLLRARPVGRTMVTGLAVSFAAAAAAFFLIGAIAGIQGTVAPAEAPDFELAALEGEGFRLSDHRGRYVVLNFWASWCGPCRAEIPELKAFRERIEEEGDDDAGPLLIGINQTASESGTTSLRSFVEREGMNFLILLDTGNRVHAQYGIRGIPTTVIVNPNGTIAAKRTGAVTRGWLRSMTR